MEKRITVTTTEQAWQIKNALIADGYTKTADCYWAMIFEKDDIKVVVERQ